MTRHHLVLRRPLTVGARRPLGVPSAIRGAGRAAAPSRWAATALVLAAFTWGSVASAQTAPAPPAPQATSPGCSRTSASLLSSGDEFSLMWASKIP